MVRPIHSESTDLRQGSAPLIFLMSAIIKKSINKFLDPDSDPNHPHLILSSVACAIGDTV